MDADAFEAFYREHVDAVGRFLARRLDNPELIADLTADVFLAALGSADRYQVSQGAPRAWLCGIARHIVASRRRRDRRERRAFGRVRDRAVLDHDDLVLIDRRLDAEAQRRALYAAMRHLPDGQRAVLELVALDDLTIAEVAVALGISAVTVRFDSIARDG